MLLKCQTSPSHKRVSQANQLDLTAAGGSSINTSSNQFLSGFGASRLPAVASGRGKRGKNIRNGGSVGGGNCVGSGVTKIVTTPGAGGAVNLATNPSSTVTSKLHRKVLRIPSKRIPGRVHSGKFASVASKLTATKQRLQQQQQQLQQHSHFGLQQQQQRPVTTTSCDNSNDSGVGFDRGIDSTTSNPQLPSFHPHQHQSVTASATTTTTSSSSSALGSEADRPIHHSRVMSSPLMRPAAGRLPGKRPPMRQSTTSSAAAASSSSLAYTSVSPDAIATASQSQLPCATRDGKVQLQILTQPEQQHRARYQTEGSRGAVKDRSGNGFPVVRLVGYGKPAVLQVFIGTDLGRVLPHMFYQACKVSGKNSTPCVERKLEGTMVIEVDMKPENEMTVTCDCVGILKERNVDVEHRFPDQSGPRAKKKSTRCRMVFRTAVTNEDGTIEMLQVCSQPIVCTQPPGIPEICKKSLVSCPAEGGLEMFIIGKNFLKDTKVVFQRRRAPLGASTSSKPPISVIPWEQSVIPDKEYLQQTHLICTVPAYVTQDIVEPVVVQIFVLSAGKKSEGHNFTYTPKGHHSALTAATTMGTPAGVAGSSFFGSGDPNVQTTSGMVTSSTSGVTGGLPGGSVGSCSGTVTLGTGGNTATATSFNSLNSSFNSQPSEGSSSMGDVSAVERSMFFWGSQQAQALQNKLDTGMMPPPGQILPLPGTPGNRRSSLLAEQLAMSSPPSFKSELIDENSRSPLNDDSLDRFPAPGESSIDNGQIMYRRRSVRQPSMDMMEDSSSMSMLVNENSAMDVTSVSSTIAGFRGELNALMETNEMSNSSTSPSASELKVMDLCIKQDVHKLASVTNQLEHMITASSTPLDTLNQVDGMKSPFKVDNLLGTAVQQTGKQVIESTLASIVNSQHAAVAIMELGSVMSHPSSNPSSMATTSPMMQTDIASPNNSTNVTSPSQDVMLAVQPSVAVASPSNLILASSPTSNDASPHPHTALSPEVILNPTVSPTTMICSPVNATVAATAAAAVAAAAAVSEGTNMLTNQVLSNMAVVAANIIESQPKETTQAVQDIILNAAAEILTSQEPSVTTQTTINALITMNAQEMMTTSCQPPTTTQQHSLLPQCQPTPMVSNTMAEALQQQQIVQSLITENLQQQPESLMATLAAAPGQHQTQQQQQQQQTQMQQPPPEQMEIGNAIVPLTVRQPAQQPMDTTGPHIPINPLIQPQQQEPQHQQQQHLQPQPNQQAQQQGQPPPPPPPSGSSTTAAAASIPQELTIMSDNDLISYINPNAFDGV